MRQFMTWRQCALLAALIVVMLSGYAYYINSTTSKPFEFPEEGYVDPSQSEHVAITATVRILNPQDTIRKNEKPDTTKQWVLCQISVLNKTDKVLRAVEPYAKLSEEISAFKLILWYSPPNVSPVNIQPGKGWILNTQFEIPNLSELTKEERQQVMDIIRSPQKLVVRWRDGEERFLIRSEQIKLLYGPSKGHGG